LDAKDTFFHFPIKNTFKLFSIIWISTTCPIATGCPWIYYHSVYIFVGSLSDSRPIQLLFLAGLPNLPLDPFLSVCTQSPSHFSKRLVHFLFIMSVLKAMFGHLALFPRTLAVWLVESSCCCKIPLVCLGAMLYKASANLGRPCSHQPFLSS
jgi:hypothetical protein